MPTLSQIQPSEGLKDLTINFDGDVSLTMKLDVDMFTVAFLKQIRDLDDADIPGAAEGFFSLVKDWDLTDDKGKKLPLDESTIGILKVKTVMRLLTRIQESQNPNPETSI